MQKGKAKAVAVDLDVRAVVEAAKAGTASNVVEVAKDLELLLK